MRHVLTLALALMLPGAALAQAQPAADARCYAKPAGTGTFPGMVLSDVPGDFSVAWYWGCYGGSGKVENVRVIGAPGDYRMVFPNIPDSATEGQRLDLIYAANVQYDCLDASKTPANVYKVCSRAMALGKTQFNLNPPPVWGVAPNGLDMTAIGKRLIGTSLITVTGPNAPTAPVGAECDPSLQPVFAAGADRWMRVKERAADVRFLCRKTP